MIGKPTILPIDGFKQGLDLDFLNKTKVCQSLFAAPPIQGADYRLDTLSDELPNYGGAAIVTHGGPVAGGLLLSTSHTVATQDPVTRKLKVTDMAEYAKFYPLMNPARGRPAVVFACPAAHKPDCFLAATDQFIERELTGRMQNGIIVLDACHSLDSNALAVAFYHRGARAIFGVKGQVTLTFASSVTGKLFQCLLDHNAGGALNSTDDCYDQIKNLADPNPLVARTRLMRFAGSQPVSLCPSCGFIGDGSNIAPGHCSIDFARFSRDAGGLVATPTCIRCVPPNPLLNLTVTSSFSGPFANEYIQVFYRTGPMPIQDRIVPAVGVPFTSTASPGDRAASALDGTNSFGLTFLGPGDYTFDATTSRNNMMLSVPSDTLVVHVDAPR